MLGARNFTKSRELLVVGGSADLFEILNVYFGN